MPGARDFEAFEHLVRYSEATVSSNCTGDRQSRILVYKAHQAGPFRPIFRAVLHDADVINPDILDRFVVGIRLAMPSREGPGEGDGLLECPSEGISLDMLF